MNESDDNENDKWNPRKFRLEARHEVVAVSSVEEHNESMNLDILIAQCHGLVMTNQEIWERCQPFHCKTIPSDDKSNCDKFIFYRVGYWVVSGRRNGLDSFVIETTAEVMKACIGIPIHLPARLECISPVLPKEEDAMPNYELLLKRFMLLSDDVLPGFLIEFKSFLEKQQVVLGIVDTWLLQSKECADFLKDHFGVTLKRNFMLPSHISSYELCFQQLASQKCSKCQNEFSDHKRNEEQVWVNCSSGGQSGSFPLEGTVTKLLEYTCNGKIEFELCIQRPEDQWLLVKLLEGLGSNVVPPT